MTIPNPFEDAQAYLNDLRRRVLAGEDVTLEEYAALIQSLRARRAGDIAEKKASKKKSSSTQVVDLPDILKDI